MNDILKEIESDKYKKKLLQCWIASRIAYNEELDENEVRPIPKIKGYEENYLKFDHGIENIISSKHYTNNTEMRNLSKKILSKHVICECSNQRLIVALTIVKPEDKEKENNFVVDFFASIEDSSSTIFEYKELDSINKCISYHGSLIPIDHLIDKLIGGYELVFTGYSFGAALAAFLAIRVLLTKREGVNLNRVSFIGFGCPLFINETLQKFIDENKQHEDKFYFYRHENDFNVNFFDLNTAILKKLAISSESESMNFMIAKLNQSKVSISYHPFELDEENRKFFDTYLNTVEQYLGSQYFSNDEFKQQPFVRFGRNLTINSTGNKIDLDREEKYYNIETLKSKIKSSYNLDIKDYFNGYFHVLKEQKNNTNISYLEGFKIENGNGTFEYKCYQEYSKKFENSIDSDINDIFTVVVIKSKNGDNDVFLGIYKSKSYLKTIIGPIMYIGDDRLVYSEYREHLKTIWYKFKPMKKLTRDDRIKFTLYTFYEAIQIGPIVPPAEMTEIELESVVNFEDKKICTYEMALDLLYIHAFFFVYLVSKSKEKKGRIFENYEKVLANFGILDGALKRQTSGFNIFKVDTKRKEFIKQMYERLNIGNNDDDIKDSKRAEEFSTFENKPSEFNLSAELINITENESKSKEQLDKLLLKFIFLKLAIVSLVEKPKLLWTCLTNVSDKYNELEIFELFRRAMWYFKVDQEADLKYIYGVKELEKRILIDEKQFQYLGFYEEIIRNNKKALEGEEIQGQLAKLFVDNKIFLDSVVSNFNIREALEDSCLVGIVGLKKAGKSTFTDFILKERRNLGSASIETNEMSAYRFDDQIDMLLVDYPHHNSTDEFYAIQFECSKYILDYAFVVCDTKLIGDTMIVDLVNLLRALNGLGLNRYCVIMNRFDELMGENGFEAVEKYFLANQINKYLHEKKNLIISLLEEFDREKHFQTNREELKQNLTIIPTCLTIDKSSDPQIQYKYQKAGIMFGEHLKRKLLNTIADNIRNVKNQEVKENLKKMNKKVTEKKCTFITKLNIKQKIRYKTVEIDIDKKNDKFEDIVETIRISLNGIGDSFCIKPEILSTRYRKLDIDKNKEDNKVDTTSISLSGNDSSFFIKPELLNTRNRNLDIGIKKENELFTTITISSNGNGDSFSINPISKSITSIDGFFDNDGFVFIVEKNNQKECAFEMDQDPKLKPLEKSINRESKFNDLQQEIRNYFKIESLKTFWIKPQISLPDSEPITSTDEFFNSTGFTYIVEIYKECDFKMKQNEKCIIKKCIIKKLKFDKLKEEIMEYFKIKSIKSVRIIEKKSDKSPETIIRSVFDLFVSTESSFIVEK